MFKKGDKVRCVSADSCSNMLQMGGIYTVAEDELVDEVDQPRVALVGVGAGSPPLHWFSERFEAVSAVIEPCLPFDTTKQGPDQCLRLNTGKPELAYLLSFDGGVTMAFAGSRFQPGLGLLACWYRGERDEDELDEAIRCLVYALDPGWPALLALVSVRGAEKYSRGNYLKGMSWHQILCCALRHMDAVERRHDAIDPESGIHHDGHIAWNLLFLLHCVLNHPEFDDRLRAP